MSLYLVDGNDLSDIADTIRAKNNSNSSLSFPDDFISAIENIETTNSDTVVEPVTGVNFIDDYDGSVVYSYTVPQFMALTELPPNPVHEGLTSQGWNWTLADAKTQVEFSQYLDIGQMYITTDGKTHVHIHLTGGRLSPNCGIRIKKGEVEIDWGDGSETDTLANTGSSFVFKTTQHTYASDGDYIIKLNVLSGTAQISSPNGFCGLCSKNQTASGKINENKVYARCIQKIYVGADTEIYQIYGCPNLISFTTPNWTENKTGSYWGNGIEGCSSLKTLTFPSNIPTAGQSNNCVSLKYISIPKSVTALGGFKGSAISSIALPTSLATLGQGSFSSCRNLKTIKIPNNTSFDTSCFSSSGIVSIELPSALATLSNYSFDGCKFLEKIVLPEGLTQVGTGAFRDCSSLKEITFSSTITKVNSNSFENCTALKKVNISNLKNWCAIAFSSSDANPLYPGRANLYLNNNKIINLVIPTGVTEIKGYTFYNANIESVSFPEGLITIGEYAFASCIFLKSIIFSSTITTLGNYTFAWCSSLQEINIPDNITNLGNDFCYQCTSLMSAKLSANASVIPSYCCYSAPLKNLILPTSYQEIGGYAFSSYPYASFVIPDTVTTIAASAFSGSNLSSITIGTGITNIPTYAFNTCYGLAEIHFKSSTPPTVANANAWTSLPTDCKIYVPTGSLSAYTSANKYPSSSTYTYIEE